MSRARSSAIAQSSAWISVERAKLRAVSCCRSAVLIRSGTYSRRSARLVAPWRLGEIAGPQVRRADRVRLLQHEPPPRVEAIGRHPHRHRQEEGHERQERTHEHPCGPLLLVGCLRLPPAPKAVADLEDREQDGRGQCEDADDRERVEELLRVHRPPGAGGAERIRSPPRRSLPRPRRRARGGGAGPPGAGSAGRAANRSAMCSARTRVRLGHEPHRGRREAEQVGRASRRRREGRGSPCRGRPC